MCRLVGATGAGARFLLGVGGAPAADASKETAGERAHAPRLLPGSGARARGYAVEGAESEAAAPVASAPPPPPPPSRLPPRPGGRESRPRPPRGQSDPRSCRVRSQRSGALRGDPRRGRPSAGACKKAPGPQPRPEQAGQTLAPRSRGAARLEEAAAGPGLSMNRSHRHGAGSGCLSTMEVKSKVRGARAGRSGRPDGVWGLGLARDGLRRCPGV